MTDRMRYLGRCQAEGCFIEKRFRLTEFDGLLPRGSNFEDLDGWVEIGGRFLFIEHKPEGFSWDDRNRGQWYALKRLARLPGVTVWWFRDCGDGYEVAEIGRELVKVSKDEMREMIRVWGNG